MTFKFVRVLGLALSLVLPAPTVRAQAGNVPVVLVVGDIDASTLENRDRLNKLRSETFDAFVAQARARVVSKRVLERFRENFVNTEQKFGEELLLAREELANGKLKYERLQLKEAVVHLENARRLLILNLPGLRSNRDLTDAHLYLGISYSALNRKEDARKEFRNLVLLDPALELSSREYSPSATEQFAKARQEVMAQEPVRLQLETDPPGATAYLNGRLYGVTPIDVSLQPGEHFLLIQRDGSQLWFQPIRLRRRLEVMRIPLQPDVEDTKWANLFRVREGSDQASEDIRVLDHLLKTVKANAVVLLSVRKEKGFRILGQLYEGSEKRFSKVALLDLGDDLESYSSDAENFAEILIGFFAPNGRLRSETQISPPAPSYPVAETNASRESIQSAPPAPKSWYRRWWIWPLIAGFGVGVYFGAREMGGSGSAVVLNNQGNF